jgi:hypothetical protein
MFVATIVVVLMLLLVEDVMNEVMKEHEDEVDIFDEGFGRATLDEA